MKHARNFIDLTGQKIGRLTFLEYVERTEQGNARWRVRCDCGTECIVTAANVIHGSTRSCGCIRVEMLKARGKDKRYEERKKLDI